MTKTLYPFVGTRFVIEYPSDMEYPRPFQEVMRYFGRLHSLSMTRIHVHPLREGPESLISRRGSKTLTLALSLYKGRGEKIWIVTSLRIKIVH